jgi:hypothetical protein
MQYPAGRQPGLKANQSQSRCEVRRIWSCHACHAPCAKKEKRKKQSGRRYAMLKMRK